MSRTKAFDETTAIDAAIEAFAEHGFAGTSARMLTQAMGIGRQSIYDTFGDKWRLYLSALRRYTQRSIGKQLADLRGPTHAIDGLSAHLRCFADEAARSPSCLGLSSTNEFGGNSPDIAEISRSAQALLADALSERIRDGKAAGAIAADLGTEEATRFLMATLSAIKIAARGGASATALQSLASVALRALR